MNIPSIGAVLISPKGNERVVRDVSAKRWGDIQLEGESYWRYWPWIVEKGWHVKTDAPQWPDADFEKAKAVADELVKGAPYDHGTLGDFVSAVRAEEARREPPVCGATHRRFTSVTCIKAPHGDTSGHHIGVGPDTGSHYDWYDPPSCDRPHLSDAAAQVISAARLVSNANSAKDVPGLYTLREHLEAYDQEDTRA